MTVILYLFIKVTFLAVFMTCLTQLKYSVKKSYIIIIACNLIIWIANCLIYFFKGQEFLTNIFLLSASIPAFVCFSLVSKSKGFKVLFSLLTVTIFGMFTSYIESVSSYTFNNLPSVDLFSQFFCLALIIIFIIKIFRKSYFKMLDTFDTGWGLFCSVPSLLAIIIFLLQYYPTSINKRPENIPVVFIVYVLMFVSYTIIYFTFDNISQYYKLKQDKNILLINTEMQKIEYQAMTDKLSAVQIYRHDMKHHINAINSFLYENNVLEAQKYLGKLNVNLSNTIIEKYCENFVVNVILSSYINKAKKEDINVISKVDLSESIKVDDIELGVVFANAIENAINACKNIQNPTDRNITVICKMRSDQIYIQIANAYNNKITFDGEYPVSNQKDHGIGTRSIAAIAEKYNGIFSFTAESGIFKTTVILNNS